MWKIILEVLIVSVLCSLISIAVVFAVGKIGDVFYNVWKQCGEWKPKPDKDDDNSHFNFQHFE